MKRKTFILTLMMMLCSFAFGQASYYWPQPSYDWPNTANYTCVIQINGEKVSNSNYELGAFCGEILRGRQRLSGSGETARYYLNVYGEGDNSETITFKLYDHNTQKVLDIACETTFALVANETKGEYLNPFVIKFNDYVAQVGGNKYSTLAAAFAAATDDQTVVMLKNVTEEFAISNTANVTFDMDGYTLTGAIKPSTANLTVTNGTIVNNNISYSAIEITSGSLVLNDNVKVSSVRHAIRIDGAVAATIKGGEYTLIPKSDRTHHALNVSGAAKVTIEGGKFVGPKGTASDSGAAVNVQKDATVVISGGEFSGGKTKTLSSDGTLSLTGGKYDQDVKGFCAAGYTTVKEGDWYTVVKAVAKIAETNVSYKTLQEAVDACAAGNNTIVLLANNGENVTVVQKEGINVTIDGGENTRFDYSGTFTIHGQSRSDGAETLTFVNIDFTTDKAGHYFIDSNSTASAERYAHNVTVENCNFTATEAGVDSAAAMRIRQGFNIAINGGEFKYLHSALQAYGNTGITVDGITLEGKNGISAGTSTKVVVKNSNITATGYGVRADGTGAYDMTLANNTITANLPVVVRKTTGEYRLTVERGSYTADNVKGAAVTFTTGDDGTFEAPTSNATATITGDVTTFGFEARIDNVYYTKFDYAYAAATEGQTIELFRTVVITDDYNYNKAITVKADFNDVAFRVKAEVSFNNMTIESNDYCVIVGADAEDGAGKLIINGGTYKGETSVASVTKGTLTINGGEFSIVEYENYDYAYLINCFDANYKNGTATVEIKGGKFYNWNPENNAAEGAGTDFCVYGYFAVETSGNVYEVVEGLLGEGTEEKPFLIRNLKELTFFRDHVNGGGTKYNTPGVWVALDADIDMAGVNWVGIGSAYADHGFMGNFDGKNYTIKNLTITNPAIDSDGYAYAGLFAVTEGTETTQNTIKNLTIENVTITTAGHIVSAAIAYPYYTIVDNVKVFGNIAITGGDYTAGALAYTRRCVNASNIAVSGNENSYITGRNTVGGVISDIQMNGGLTAIYSNFSASNVTVSGEMHVGGISGIISKQTLNGATVKDVTLICSDSRVGIVSGSLGETSTITNVDAENVTGATAIIGATYKDGKPVEARITDTYYATLEAALKAAQEDDVITLLVPYTVEAGEELTINKKVVYTSDVLGEAMITNNGTLTITGSVAYTYTGAADATYSKGNYTINNYGTLTVEGNVENNTAKMSHASYAINNMSNATTTINSGKVVNAGNYAIRQFASGSNTNTLTITGGEVKGTRAVWMQAAGSNTADAPAIVLNVNGGTLTGTGESADYTLAVYSYSYGNDMKNVAINVTKGTINGDIALTGGNNKTNIETVNISGGTFNGDVYSYGDDTENRIVITGGKFKTNNSEMYAENDGSIFVWNAEDNYYHVTTGTYVARNTTTGQGYVTLQAAVDAAEAGHTIELLQDITLTGGYANDAEAGLGIEKDLTINGGNHTINCGDFIKGIRIYNNKTIEDPDNTDANYMTAVNINDVTVINEVKDGRCIDTRSGNIDLNIKGVTLSATNGNSQPLTIGGDYPVRHVVIKNSTIDAGYSGYGVISFVSTIGYIQCSGTNVSGYAAFYLKGDGKTNLQLSGGTYIGKNIHSGESNNFGTIVAEGDGNNVTVNMSNPIVKAIATGNAAQAAFMALGEKTAINLNSGSYKVITEGENAYWAMIDAEVAESTQIIDNSTNNNIRLYPAAEADGFQFMTLAEAVRYAKAGNTVTVVNDNTVAEPVVIAKDLTLDLNGEAITATGNVYPVIRVQGDANVTVTGEGSITNEKDYVFTLGSSDQKTAGNLTINGGTYVGATSVASVTTGTLTINGGDFSLVEGTTDYRYLINCVDANYKNGTAKVAIYGGTFHNWNPEDNAAENPKANFCAPGYIAFDNNDGSYTVIKGVWQAQIEGGAKFQKLEYAIVAAGAKATINVLSSFETEISYTIAKTQNITLNLNGQTITGTDNTTKNFGLIQNNGTLTVNDTNGGKMTVVAKTDSGTSRYSAVISNNPGATLTVNGGTLEHLGGTYMAYGIDALTNGNIGDVNTTINGGTIKSTYRAVRQFLNSDSKENNLTVNGGTLEGVNKSIFFHDPSAKANNGTVTVRENAVLNGDVYLFVTDGSLVWPVNVSIAESALNGQLTSANVPDGYVVEERDGFYSVYGEQSYAFVQGWNWFSTYLDYNDIEVFQAPLKTNATQIKSQTAYTSYSGGEWNNMSLTTVNVKQTYMVKTAQVSFDITAGKVVNPKDHAITIMGAKDEKPSWTWIGYTLGTGISVDEAFPQPNEGDYVKSQDEFALFEDGEWHGSLNVMTPGKGFMYKNVGVEKTHTYPVSVTNTRSRAENVTTENNHWVADARMYPTNMTMVAVLNIDGNEMDDEFEVAAFSNGEVRGSARAIYVSSLGRYMFFMTIYGENNDELTFKYYDIASEEEHAIDFRTVYAENASLGSIKDPRVLHCGALNVEEMSANTIALYPNPTTTGREIKFETTCDMVEVFNSLGVKVAEYRNVNSIDGIETAGVYVIRVTNDSAVQNCRLIVK